MLELALIADRITPNVAQAPSTDGLTFNMSTGSFGEENTNNEGINAELSSDPDNIYLSARIDTANDQFQVNVDDIDPAANYRIEVTRAMDMAVTNYEYTFDSGELAPWSSADYDIAASEMHSIAVYRNLQLYFRWEVDHNKTI